MSNRIWTADGRIIDIDISKKTSEVINNVIEPFSIFSSKVEDANKIKQDYEKSVKLEKEKQRQEKKILFIKPNSNNSLSNLCFYRDKYSDGTFGSYNNPPLIEVTGNKCSPNENKSSLGMEITNIRSVNNLKGSGTIRDKKGFKCELNRKDMNDSYIQSLYFGDCFSDPLYWKEEKDEKKLQEYRNALKPQKISDYIPKLKIPEDNTNDMKKSKYNAQVSTVLTLDPAFKAKLLNNKSKDEISNFLHTDQCFGGSSEVQKKEKTKSIVNSFNKLFDTDVKSDKVSGNEGIHVNLYGNRCPPNSKSYFGIDVQMLETTDKNGNIRTFNTPTVTTIPNKKGNEVFKYDKQEKCSFSLSELNPLLKNALVGDCDNPPTALKRKRSSKIDNYTILYDNTKFKTTEEKKSPRRPGLAGYNIQLAKPKCNFNTKNIVEMKDLLKSCSNDSKLGNQITNENAGNQHHLDRKNKLNLNISK